MVMKVNLPITFFSFFFNLRAPRKTNSRLLLLTQTRKYQMLQFLKQPREAVFIRWQLKGNILCKIIFIELLRRAVDRYGTDPI